MNLAKKTGHEVEPIVLVVLIVLGAEWCAPPTIAAPEPMLRLSWTSGMAVPSPRR
jgi:hypothetical protein